MCFKSDSTMKKPKKNWGYKVFRAYSDGGLHGEYAGKGKERKRNVWLDEEGFRPTREDLTFTSAGYAEKG